MAHSRKTKVAALSSGNALSGVTRLVTLAVLSRVLLKEDYAAYRQTVMIYTFVSPILLMGIPQGLFYFLPVETERFRGRVMDALVLLAMSGSAFALFILCGGNVLLASAFENPQVASLLTWIALYTVVALPSAQVAPVLNIRDRFLTLAFFNVSSQTLIGVGAILPALVWTNAEAPIVGRAVAGMVSGAVALFLIFRYSPKDSWQPTRSGTRELLWFSFPLGIAVAAGVLQRRIDQLIVSALTTPAEFAVYANGATEVPLIGVVTGAITAVLIVDIRKCVAKGDHAGALRLFRLTAEKSSYLVLPAMLFFLVSAEAFIETLYSSKYRDSVHPFRIYLLMLPIRTVIFASLLLAMGKGRFILIRTIYAVVLGSTLGFFLVRWIGPNGAAIATVLVTYLFAVPANLYELSRSLSISWVSFIPWSRMANILMVYTIPTAILYLVNMQTSALHPAVRLSINATLFGAFSLWYLNGKIYNLASVVERLRRRG